MISCAFRISCAVPFPLFPLTSLFFHYSVPLCALQINRMETTIGLSRLWDKRIADAVKSPEIVAGMSKLQALFRRRIARKDATFRASALKHADDIVEEGGLLPFEAYLFYMDIVVQVRE